MDLSRDRSPQQTKSTASPKTPKQWHRRQCPYGFRTRFSRTRENFRYGSEGGESGSTGLPYPYRWLIVLRGRLFEVLKLGISIFSYATKSLPVAWDSDPVRVY